MATKNTLQSNAINGQPKLSAYLTGEAVNRSLVSMLGDRNAAQKFIGSLVSATSINPQLQACDNSTVVSAALLANSLKLSLSPSIGHCYLVPFEDKKNNRSVATFILGWKGYAQLAERSGYYERINVVEIKQGEVVKIDRINEEYIFAPVENDTEREKLPTIGYYAFFRYNKDHGGFSKAMYWTKEKMLLHADKYSKAFNLEAVKGREPRYDRVSYQDFVDGKYPKEDSWKYSSYWYSDFDGMAKKTMIRQLIGKWGIMSVDFQQAYEADGGYIDQPGGEVHFDTNPEMEVLASKHQDEQSQEDMLPWDDTNTDPAADFYK